MQLPAPVLDAALDDGGPVPADRHPDRHQVNGTPLIRPTTRPRRSRWPSLGDSRARALTALEPVVRRSCTRALAAVFGSPPLAATARTSPCALPPRAPHVRPQGGLVAQLRDYGIVAGW